MYRPQDPPHRFSNQTLIGNWFEERALERALYDQTQFGKYSMDLKSTKQFQNSNQMRQNNALIKAPLSYLKESDCVKFGMSLMLYNGAQDCFLAVNVLDKRQNCFGGCGTKQTHNVRRSVFKIQSAKGESDDVIRFGDQVKITTLSSLFGGVTLYLTSKMMPYNQVVQPTSVQELFFSMTENYDSTWQIECPDFERRFKGVADEVRAGDRFLLKHCATGKLMAVGPATERNDFGKEQQVFVENFETRNKSQNLLKEMVGEKGCEQVNKNYKDENQWVFQGARNQFDQFEENAPDAYIKGLTILEDVVDRILSQGPFALVDLKNEFSKLDSQKSGKMHKEDFFWTLNNCGIKVTQAEFDIMSECLEREGENLGYLRLFEQFASIITPRKLEMIEIALKTIATKYPVLRFENLIKMYNCIGMSKQEVNAFVRSWGAKQVDQLITVEELRAYLQQICACTKTEDELCQFIRKFTS